MNTNTAQPTVSYEFSRLCFRSDLITPLTEKETFRVTTPVGIFQMSKAEFLKIFGHVTLTRSWRQGGIYHYPKVPQKAEQFLVG